MKEQIRLGVYRRLDNRLEGIPDDSPFALELHERRKNALHEVFDSCSEVKVISWGDSDDSRPHEWVELTLAIEGARALVVPVLAHLGVALAKAAVDATTAEVVKWLIAKLRSKQEAKQIWDISITLPDGTAIRCNPPEMDGQMTIAWSTGGVESIQFSSGDATKHTAERP